MSVTPGSGPGPRAQASSASSLTRRVWAGRRERRKGGRRVIPVQLVVQGANPSAKAVIFEITGISQSFNTLSRVCATELPIETAKLDSELNDIFRQLKELDISISNANQAIDELKESTRSIIRNLLSKG